MRDLISQLPDQLRWAAGIDPPRVAEARSAVVAGMGGSGIGGEVASVVAAASGRRVLTHKSYGLPPWLEDGDLVVAVSHSGNTEETLSAARAAVEAGLPLAGVASGGTLRDVCSGEGVPFVEIPPGPQPRAAFGHLAGATLRVLEAASLVRPQSEELLEAADVVEGLLEGEGPATAAAIAASLTGRFVLVIGGAGVGGVAANRWKTQINENAKSPSAWQVLPEADHNEIVGWSADPQLADMTAAVFLIDSEDHARISRRSRLTRQLLEQPLGSVAEVGSRGTGTLARLFSLAVIGDLVSVSLAEAAGVDPMPVDVIETLKSKLAEEAQ